MLREFSAMSEIAELLGPSKEKLLELFNVSANGYRSLILYYAIVSVVDAGK